MITADLDAALAEAVRAALSAGELAGPGAWKPAAERRPGIPDAAGTWRPARPDAGTGPEPGTSPEPGSYASTIPFLLAKGTSAGPTAVAAVLAARLRDQGGISQVSVTGGGYLTMTVTQDALAGLAVRIVQAGSGCARSQALRGTRLTAARDAQLTRARSWDEARQRLAAELAGRLAEAAGAQVSWAEPDALSSAPGGPVADAVRFAGEDAVRYALSRLGPGGPGRSAGPGPGRPAQTATTWPDGPGRSAGSDLASLRAPAAQHLGNPAYAVRYAHAHAASAVRQAADIGLTAGEAERFAPRLLAHPGERALLSAMSWLPERVAGAARRHQPHVLTAYLEDLAVTYSACQESCPAAAPGTFRPAAWPAPAEPLLLPARLWLAEAARTVLGTGLGLLGIAAPDRL